MRTIRADVATAARGCFDRVEHRGRAFTEFNARLCTIRGNRLRFCPRTGVSINSRRAIGFSAAREWGQTDRYRNRDEQSARRTVAGIEEAGLRNIDTPAGQMLTKKLERVSCSFKGQRPVRPNFLQPIAYSLRHRPYGGGDFCHRARLASGGGLANSRGRASGIAGPAFGSGNGS
jgi:hypothetical protein